MTKTIKRALENGLIFIEDTSSCVSVACLHEIDGEAELSLEAAGRAPANLDLAFDGMIETPTRKLMISAASGEPLLVTKVPSQSTRIRVWRNHPDWPDKVVVGWG
jgi:hypothetical protein